MSGGHRARANHHWAEARCCQYRDLGERSWGEAFSGTGTRFECVGDAGERARQVYREKFSTLFRRTQEYCLWLGCMGAYDPRGREIVLALVRILRHLNVSFGVLRKEKCTGDPVRRLGNDLLFQQLAEFNLEALAQSKTKKILSICPHCVRTIQEDWKAYGTPPEVEHHSEFLARHMVR